MAPPKCVRRRRKVPLESCCLHSLNQETDNDLEKIEKSLGVSGEYPNDADCPFEAASVASFWPTIGYIADRWPFLPPHIREAILTLVDSGTSPESAEERCHE
jgi:hypothetical protein